MNSRRRQPRLVLLATESSPEDHLRQDLDLDAAGDVHLAPRNDIHKDVMVSWLPGFHALGMVGFLTIPTRLRRGAGQGDLMDFSARTRSAVGQSYLQEARHHDLSTFFAYMRCSCSGRGASDPR